jgi:hypothetical protein
MPRYFFNSEDGSLFCDEDGAEIPDLATARREAVRLLGESLQQGPGLMDANGWFRIEVTDEQRRRLFLVTARFEEAERLTRP